MGFSLIYQGRWARFERKIFRVLQGVGVKPIVMVLQGSKILPEILTKCKRRLFLLGFLLKCFRACLRLEKESDRGALQGACWAHQGVYIGGILGPCYSLFWGPERGLKWTYLRVIKEPLGSPNRALLGGLEEPP